MSPEVKIRILAQDVASPSIQRVAGSLRSLKSEGHSAGQAFGFLQQAVSTAMGFISANIVQNGVFALQQLSREAFNSISNFERLSIMLEGMVARDIKRASNGALSYQVAPLAGGVD